MSMTMTTASDNSARKRHAPGDFATLPIEEQHRFACPGIVDIEDAVAANPDCAGNTDARRWHYCNQGPWSHTHAPELLVLVSKGFEAEPFKTANWYGHVFCHNEHERNYSWVSILVRTWEEVGGESDDEILYRYLETVIREGKRESVWRHGPDDIASKHGTFREAVDALAEKVRNFSRRKHEPTALDDDQPPMPESERCTRCDHAYDTTGRLVADLLGDGIGGPRPVRQRLDHSAAAIRGAPRFALADDRIAELEIHTYNRGHYPYPDNTPDRIPSDEDMELRIVYGAFSRRNIYMDPEVAAGRILETLGCWYGTMRNNHLWHYLKHERWPEDMHCLLSQLVDIEFMPLQRFGIHAAYHPFAALLRTSIVLNAKSRYAESLFLRYEGKTVNENKSNNPGRLAILRQENRPRAEFTEHTWRDAVRWERPHQCAWKCQ